MKAGFRTLSFLLAIALLLGGAASSFADEVTVDLVSRILQSFDPDEQGMERAREWQLIPSKFGYDENGNSYWELRLVQAWPVALFGKNRDNQDLQVLGLHGSFARQGYNYVEIVPGHGQGESFEPDPIPLPGRAQALDVWVWGANYNYYLEAHVRDFHGVDHVLPLGSLRYIGWKDLRVTIPGSVPQGQQYVPKYRQAVLTKLVLWTRPNERVDDYYMYIDQIKVLTDLFETSYDGDNLSDVEEVQKIWGGGN